MRFYKEEKRVAPRFFPGREADDYEMVVGTLEKRNSGLTSKNFPLPPRPINAKHVFYTITKLSSFSLLSVITSDQ